MSDKSQLKSFLKELDKLRSKISKKLESMTKKTPLPEVEQPKADAQPTEQIAEQTI